MSKFEENNVNIFKSSFYSFVPLNKLESEWLAFFKTHQDHVVPDSRIRNVDGTLYYCEIENEQIEVFFNYCFCHDGTKESKHREVSLRVFLIKFISPLNPTGSFYLTIGTGIDKVFKDADGDELCDRYDLISLKKAFYERGERGVQVIQSNGKVPFHDWLNSLVKKLTGKDPNGRYGRHYVINIQAVAANNSIPKEFNHLFYDHNIKSYKEIITDADKLAYALLYGNDKICVVPDETIAKAFRNLFSNNMTQQLYAGNKTIVFFETHDTEKCVSNTPIEKPLDINIVNAPNIFEICFVMEAKRRLKKIQKLMNLEHPSKTREVLASISA